jgi:hypothetical protein
MGLPCNFSADLSGLQNIITGQLGTLLNLRGLIGTPPGLVALQGALTGVLATAQAGLAGLLPAIPFGKEFLSLRDQLGDFAGGLTGDIEGLLGNFSEGLLGDLDIGVDINIGDLANSAIRLGANFDPCSLVSDIPNIVKDPMGNLFKGPSMPPFLGKTDFGIRNVLGNQSFTDVMGTVDSLSTSFDTITNVTDGIDALKNNVTGSISGLGNTLIKTATGETKFLSQGDFVTELKSRASKMNESNFPTIFASKEEEDAHNANVADLLMRKRMLDGDNIGVPVHLQRTLSDVV